MSESHVWFEYLRLLISILNSTKLPMKNISRKSSLIFIEHDKIEIHWMLLSANFCVFNLSEFHV